MLEKLVSALITPVEKGQRSALLRFFLTIFVLLFVLYLINYFYLRYLVLPRLLHVLLKNYFNDILASLVLLSLSNCIFLRFGFIACNIKIVALYTLLFSFIFEGLTPIISSTATADIVDCIAYAAGSYIFYLICKFKLTCIGTA